MRRIIYITIGNLLEMNVSGRRPQRLIAIQPTIVNTNRTIPMKIVHVLLSQVVPETLKTSTA